LQSSVCKAFGTVTRRHMTVRQQQNQIVIKLTVPVGKRKNVCRRGSHARKKVLSRAMRRIQKGSQMCIGY
jgi:hypothetical protein